jgi:hypothetical protein
MPEIGILAYGSLIRDRGWELESLVVEEREVVTPFSVEFARTSRKRDGAPTLIPVADGGAPVSARLLVLREGTSKKEAQDVLWRRETDRVGSSEGYQHPVAPGPNTVVIRTLENLEGVAKVFYTEIAANIDPLTVEELARLAIRSASRPAGENRRDGISYLIDAKCAGIMTPLMPEYEREILRRTGASSLEGAYERARAEK